MKKVCKIRFYPNHSQIILINKILSCCRFVKNLYIQFNKAEYTWSGEFLTAYECVRIINKLKKHDPDYYWINGISTKAITHALLEEEQNFKRFFKTKKCHPKFKSRKHIRKESFFFIKDNIHFDTDNEYIIKIPILGKIRILQRNYLPDINTISSGRIIKEDDKFYISFIYNYEPNRIKLNKFKMGIDLGIKNYASIYLSNNEQIIIQHYKDLPKYKEIKRKIIRLQQVINHKQEINYGRLLNKYLDNHSGNTPDEITKNIMKGESYHTSRIRCLKKKIRRLYRKLNNIRKDFINKLVSSIVTRIKPHSITIEDLHVQNMLQDNNTSSKLHEAIQDSILYYFRKRLNDKCKEYNIELRIANRYFASSKTCSCCGNIKEDLTLNDRIYRCTSCGLEIDRDMNAAINLCNLKKKYYTLAV